MLKVLAEKAASEEPAFGIDEICREGARRMLAVALEAEVDAYVAEHLEDRDERGHRLVVRNGRAETRTVKTVAGAVEVTAPRVDDKRVDGESGERQRFHSSILAPWCRRSPQVSAVLPLLYLHGLSTGDFVPALSEFFGDSAGLSGPVVARLTRTWQNEQEAFASRSLADVDYVYIWVDGIHFNVRLGEDRLCCLVVVGVRADGRKELVAITGGYRESTESWASLLRDCKRRGMRAPVLAVGDGALGFWAAVRDVFPETAEQRCWFHVSANVLNALPKSVQPAARRALAEIRDAEDRAHAEAAIKAFADEFEAKWPKAVAKFTDKPEALLAFYDMPAEHWIHLKTTNPIESTFATVRLRTKVTKGAGSRSAGLAMAYKLITTAESRWRAVNAPHLGALDEHTVVEERASTDESDEMRGVDGPPATLGRGDELVSHGQSGRA